MQTINGEIYTRYNGIRIGLPFPNSHNMSNTILHQLTKVIRLMLRDLAKISKYSAIASDGELFEKNVYNLLMTADISFPSLV